MIERTADQARANYREKMGAELGDVFHALVGDLVSLHGVWGGYLALWGHSPERVEVLNEAAPAFFFRCERVYWHIIFLRLSRLTDARKTEHSGTNQYEACRN